MREIKAGGSVSEVSEVSTNSESPAFILTGKAGTYSSPDGVTWGNFGKTAPGNVLCADERGFVAASWPENILFRQRQDLKIRRPTQAGDGREQGRLRRALSWPGLEGRERAEGATAVIWSAEKNRGEKKKKRRIKKRE